MSGEIDNDPSTTSNSKEGPDEKIENPHTEGRWPSWPAW